MPLEQMLIEPDLVGIRRIAEMTVFGEDGLVRPPTFANVGKPGHGRYIINDDGEVDIDTRERQNRRAVELLYAEHADLLPAKWIQGGKGTRGNLRIGELGHRLADAAVRASRFKSIAEDAFRKLLDGDPSAVAEIDPTSLVFGAFDSRASLARITGLYCSRIVGLGATPVRSGTQYRGFIADKAEAAEKYPEDFARTLQTKKSAAETGLTDQPVPTSEAGKTMPGAEHMVGVRVKEIKRTTTVNLIRARKFGRHVLGGAAAEQIESKPVAQYVLGLALLCLTGKYDHDLRQGAQLIEKTVDAQFVWRDGKETPFVCDRNSLIREVAAFSEGFVGAETRRDFDPAMALEDMKASDAKKAKKTKKTAAAEDKKR